jgi:hypothetical protein
MEETEDGERRKRMNDCKILLFCRFYYLFCEKILNIVIYGQSTWGKSVCFLAGYDQNSDINFCYKNAVEYNVVCDFKNNGTSMFCFFLFCLCCVVLC